MGPASSFHVPRSAPARIAFRPRVGSSCVLCLANIHMRNLELTTNVEPGTWNGVSALVSPVQHSVPVPDTATWVLGQTSSQ